MKIKLFSDEYETTIIDYICFCKSGKEYCLSVCINGNNNVITQSICCNKQKTLEYFLQVRKNLERFGNFAFNDKMLVNIENALDIDIKQTKDKGVKKFYIEAILSTGDVFKSSPTKHLDKCIRLESYFLASKHKHKSDAEFEAIEKAYNNLEK